MTAPIPDDELRAMLEARAARLSPDAGREAVAGFRAAVRGAADGIGFSVLPQALGGRGARLSGSVVVLGVAVVVVLGVLGGRLGGPSDDRGDSASIGVDVPSGVATVAAGPPADPPISLDALALVRAVASGGLAGRVVVINGQVAGTDCEPATGCDYSIVGMTELPIALADDFVMRMPVASPFDEQAVLPYAFRVRDDGVLALLGVVGQGLDQPVRVDQLGAGAPIGSLAMVTGWLASEAIDSSAAPCTLARLSPPECSAARSYALSDVEATSDAMLEPNRALQVEIAPDARRGSFRPSGNGRFLVTKTPDVWRVEGRYWATVPQVQPQSPGPGPGDKLTVDQLQAGIADGSLTGRVIVIDGELPMVPVPCLRLSDCRASMPQVPGVRVAENHGFDAAIANDMPGGPHAFLGDGVGLTYLGTMSGATDTPMTAAELARVSPGAAESEIRFVEGVIGLWRCMGCPSGTADRDEQWLTDEDAVADGTVSVAVPVIVPETIEPPAVRDRYLVRSARRSGCDGAALPSGSACDATESYRWALVAAVGDEPIVRVAVP